MTRKCDVELFAVAVGVVGSSGTGYISHNLEVVSETNILQIPVQADILYNHTSTYALVQCIHLNTSLTSLIDSVADYP